MWLISKLFRDGSKEWAQLTADDDDELERAAERLRAEIHGKGGQRKHLDLNRHKRELALRYGAEEQD